MTLSSEAGRLHLFAILNSLLARTPGLVPDAYLNAVEVDSTTHALELELCGLWHRTPNGYEIDDNELLRVVTVLDTHLDHVARRHPH